MVTQREIERGLRELGLGEGRHVLVHSSYKSFGGVAYPRLSTGLYLVMGWCALVAIVPLWQRVPAWGLFWLFAGGLAYTAGVVFFSSDERVRFNHFRWHLFVVAGSSCHVVAVAGYAA